MNGFRYSLTLLLLPLACGLPARAAADLGSPASTVPTDWSDASRIVVQRVVLGGEGGWDAVTMDLPSQRLFITHATKIQVMDAKTHNVVGEIADTPGVHQVTLAPDLGRGFASNGRDSTVTVFDTKTLAAVGRIHLAARNPDAIEYDAVSRRVFAFCGGSAMAVAIDAAADSVVGTVALNGKPEFAVADGKGRIYANLEDSSAVLALDTRTLQVVGRWPLAPGDGPTGIAMDREHRRVFSGCSNQDLVVLDPDGGRVVAVLPIGKNVDGVAFDPARQLVFSSNGDGTLTVIREDAPDKYTVLYNLPTQAGARTLAVDPSSGRVYLPTAELGPPPPPTPDRPRPRGSVLPGTFVILIVSGLARAG